MKPVCQYVVIFFNFQTTSNHLHPPQVENCGSNSRLVVDEDDNGKFRIERVNAHLLYEYFCVWRKHVKAKKDWERDYHFTG